MDSETVEILIHVFYYEPRKSNQKGKCEKKHEQLYSKITPADSAIGKWNFRDYRDSYIWLSNVLYLFGNKEAAEKLSYYYGTYTCPNCGKKDKPIVKLMMLGLLNG